MESVFSVGCEAILSAQALVLIVASLVSSATFFFKKKK